MNISIVRFVVMSFLFAMLFGVLSVPAVAQQDGQPPTLVSVKHAEKLLISPQIEVPGTIISRNDSKISSEVSGRIAWIAEVGDILEAGDIIAQVDDRDLQLQLESAEASIKRLEASLVYQQKDVKRLQSLAASKNIPAARLEESVSTRDMTRQDLAQAKITKERIAYDLERTQVSAPFPGRVVERLVELGEYTTVGREVARFVDTTHVEVRAQVPVAVAPYLSIEKEVPITLGQVRHDGIVRTLIPVGDEISRTFEIRVSLPEGQWIVGSPVRVAVPNAAPEQMIAVPRDALVLRSEGIWIYRVDGENKAERVAVTPGPGQDDFIAVRGPVQVDDKVVVRGAEMLRPGQTVEVQSDS